METLRKFIITKLSIRKSDLRQCFQSYTGTCGGGLKPVFHSIISLPPARNYDSKITISHSLAAKGTSSGPPVVENFLLLFHLSFMEPKNN